MENPKILSFSWDIDTMKFVRWFMGAATSFDKVRRIQPPRLYSSNLPGLLYLY